MWNALPSDIVEAQHFKLYLDDYWTNLMHDINWCTVFSG